MNTQIDNMQKYENYKEQFGRLKKALNYKFYLEAIFIEYAIIEDRLESALKHSNKFNANKHNSLNSKLNKIKDMKREKKAIINHYLNEEIIEQLSIWKEERNRLIHALMKQNLHTNDLEKIAFEGQQLAKTISNKVKCYNNALSKQCLEEKLNVKICN